MVVVAILVGLFEGRVEYECDDTVFASDGEVISTEVLDGLFVDLTITEIVAGVSSVVDFVVDEVSNGLAIFPKNDQK